MQKVILLRMKYHVSHVRIFTLKGNAQFIQKVTFGPLMDFKQNHYGNWKYYKNCYFCCVFFTQVIKTQNNFFCDCAF